MVDPILLKAGFLIAASLGFLLLNSGSVVRAIKSIRRDKKA